MLYYQHKKGPYETHAVTTFRYALYAGAGALAGRAGGLPAVFVIRWSEPGAAPLCESLSINGRDLRPGDGRGPVSAAPPLSEEPQPVSGRWSAAADDLRRPDAGGVWQIRPARPAGRTGRNGHGHPHRLRPDPDG